jgi:hypothetical protein
MNPGKGTAADQGDGQRRETNLKAAAAHRSPRARRDDESYQLRTRGGGEARDAPAQAADYATSGAGEAGEYGERLNR